MINVGILDGETMDETIVLKKYASRRLYNPLNSSYVTLTQVADLIRAGKDIKVLDAKNNEDVTAFILTQIIMEEAKNKNALLPVPLLHLIIRYGSTVLQEFFEKHLQDTINSYLQYKQAVDDQFSKWLNMGVNYSEMTRNAMKDLSPFPGFPPKKSPRPPEKPGKKKKG
jgi:polyhydroxyalkanoate synthesis repressor PhaR